MNVTAAKAHVYKLPYGFKLAKQLQERQSVKIYNIFFLFSKVCYTFFVNKVQVTFERAGNKSALRHCWSWHHRSLKYCQRCVGGMRTTFSEANLHKFNNLWTGTFWLNIWPKLKRTSCKRQKWVCKKPPPVWIKRESIHNTKPSNRS